MIERKIDTSDIPEVTDFSKVRPNPYAERMRKYGYSVTIHYGPEYVEKMIKRNLKEIKNLDMLQLDEYERAALKKYEEANKEYAE